MQVGLRLKKETDLSAATLNHLRVLSSVSKEIIISLFGLLPYGIIPYDIIVQVTNSIVC